MDSQLRFTDCFAPAFRGNPLHGNWVRGELARAGIILQYGAEGEAHMRKYLFLRFYGEDFDEEKKRRILASWGEEL